MKVSTLDGIIYNKDTVSALRNYLITLRNEALRQNEFGDAVTLSHVIAFLAFTLTELEE